MTARRLVPVVLDGSVQTGSRLPRPRVGDIAAYSLSFGEADEHTDPADPTLRRLWITTARRDRPVELPPEANESGWLVELDLDDVPDGRTGGVRRRP